MMDNVIKFVVAYALLINVAGFVLCFWDKRRAIRHQWRIPELRFFIVALLGGGPGVLAGMYKFRHKTKHKKFTLGIPAIIIAECLLIILLKVYC